MKPIKRSVWLGELLELLRKVGNGKYYVRRGAISWSGFTWPKSFAVAVRAAENFPAEVTQLKTTTLEISVMTQIPEKNQEVDDDVLETLEEDIVLVMQALRRVKKGKDNVVANVSYQGSVEVSDLEFGVQGFYITFIVEY